MAKWFDTDKTMAELEGWSEWDVYHQTPGDVDIQTETINGVHRIRTRPRKRESKVETVTLMGWIKPHDDEIVGTFNTYVKGQQQSHSITITLIDGEPDCNSIKMEPLK